MDLMPFRGNPQLRKNESWWLNVPASPPFDETTQRCCNSQRVSVVQCCGDGLHFVYVSLYQFPWLFPSHADSKLGRVACFGQWDFVNVIQATILKVFAH